MERRDVFILLLAAGGIGYAVYNNWDLVREKLGLDDLYPGRIKAIELAKKAYSLESYRTNWEVLHDRERTGEIKVIGDPWLADPIEKPWYVVTFTFKEAGQPRRYVFHVNVATMATVLKAKQTGADATAAPPR